MEETELQPQIQASNSEVTAPVKPQKISFTEAQQARVDEIVREAQGRAAREVRTNLERVTVEKTQLEVDLAAAKAANTDYDLVEKIHGESREKDKEIADLRAVVVGQRLEAVIAEATKDVGFVDLKSVKKLTKEKVVINGANQVCILDDGGHERLNDQNKPMSIVEFYQDFAANNPHFVRSDFKFGAGSTPAQQHGSNDRIPLENVFGKHSSAELANRVSMADPKKYRAMRELARKQGLI
jgi:hypothetical protein